MISVSGGAHRPSVEPPTDRFVDEEASADAVGADPQQAAASARR